MTAPPRDIVLLAHGSPDHRHRLGVEELAARVRRLVPERGVHTAYLDHHPPTPVEAAHESGRDVAVIPVLLTPAYHVKVDVPEAVRAMTEAGPGEATATEALGPHPMLVEAAQELLATAGVKPNPDTAVVLFAAGSTDSAAVETISDMLRGLPAVEGWGPWRVAALDGGAAVDSVVGELAGSVRRVVAVAFMVAEGILRDRQEQRCLSAGVQMVPGALGHTSALARLVVERADSLPG